MFRRIFATGFITSIAAFSGAKMYDNYILRTLDRYDKQNGYKKFFFKPSEKEILNILNVN